MNLKKYIVAIDGPNGSGKSTLSKMVAKKLGITYIDTGAMYRALAYFFVKNNIEINEENTKKYIDEPKLEFSFENGKTKVVLNDEDISDKIRTPEISMASAEIAKYAVIRERLVKIQRELGSKTSVIMEGRDIASVVFPNADVKIFLTATADIRATRRYKDYITAGKSVTLEEVQAEVLKRDDQEINRKNSPLVKVEDAILLDNSNLTFEETIDKTIEIINNIINK